MAAAFAPAPPHGCAHGTRASGGTRRASLLSPLSLRVTSGQITVGVSSNVIEASWRAMADAYTYGLLTHGA